jgi:hypothetical protein
VQPLLWVWTGSQPAPARLARSWQPSDADKLRAGGADCLVYRGAAASAGSCPSDFRPSTAQGKTVRLHAMPPGLQDGRGAAAAQRRRARPWAVRKHFGPGGPRRGRLATTAWLRPAGRQNTDPRSRDRHAFILPAPTGRGKRILGLRQVLPGLWDRRGAPAAPKRCPRSWARMV